MLRLSPLALAVAIAIGGCTRATFGFRPTLTSQVPDSTVVRLRAIKGQPSITGRSLGWQMGRLTIVTMTGDTVAVLETGTLEVRLKTKKSYAAIGGVVGLGIGMGLAQARCPYPRRCAPDLRAPLGGAVGMLVGSRFRTAEWLVVRRRTR